MAEQAQSLAQENFGLREELANKTEQIVSLQNANTAGNGINNGAGGEFFGRYR